MKLLGLKLYEFKRQCIQRQSVGLVRLEQKSAALALCIESLSELAAERNRTDTHLLGTRLRAVEASCDTPQSDSTCHLRYF